MKTTLAGTVMLVLLLFAENAAAQPSWVAVAETATPAVVTIEHDEGAGSGFIVDANGTIVTNEHVIQGATGLTITLSSGETFNDAYIIMSDPARDLAILRIMGAGLPYLDLRTTPAEVGENVALIGAPQGLSSTLTTGIVSRKLIHEGSRTIQTDVSASPGSSGSPLLDEDGDVIGVLTWKLRTGDDLNFAVPIAYVRGMLDAEHLNANAKLLRRDTSAGRRSGQRIPGVQRHGGVMLGGMATGLAFWDVLRNVQDTLFNQGVTVANDEWIGQAQLWREYTGLGTSNQQMVEAAGDVGAAWVLMVHTDIRWGNTRDSATLTCLSVPTGQQIWQERVTDIAISIQGAVNDLSKDLAREIRERRGGPCVSNSREIEASREEDQEDPETPRRAIRYVVGSWTADEICNGFTGKVNTQKGHVICENGTATEIVER